MPLMRSTFRMHHARCRALSIHPVPLQMRQPLPPARRAGNIHLCGRLREREVAGAKARLRLRTVQDFQKMIENALQMSERDSLIHHEAFELVEHRRMRRVPPRRSDTPCRGRSCGSEAPGRASCAPAPGRCAFFNTTDSLMKNVSCMSRAG